MLLSLLPPHDLVESNGVVEAIATKHGPDYQVILDAWKGIGRFPLPKESIEYLRDQALDMRACILYSIDNPLIVVYRFFNNELRYFLIVGERFLVETKESAKYLRYFPFFCERAHEYELSLRPSDCKYIDQTLAWLPQNTNYSHFMSDYVGGWSFFPEYINAGNQDIAVLAVDPWMEWQSTILKAVGFSRQERILLAPGEARMYRVSRLLLPVTTSPMQSQWGLRECLRSLLNIDVNAQIDNNSLVYMSRNDHSKERVRNHGEIEDVIAKKGGTIVFPNTLDYTQKKDVFSRAKVIVGDGSASMNACLFMNPGSTYVGLLDPIAAVDSRFLSGGWSYISLIANRVRFVMGTEPKALHGSTLNSAVYSTKILEEEIESASAN